MSWSSIELPSSTQDNAALILYKVWLASQLCLAWPPEIARYCISLFLYRLEKVQCKLSLITSTGRTETRYAFFNPHTTSIKQVNDRLNPSFRTPASLVFYYDHQYIKSNIFANYKLVFGTAHLNKQEDTTEETTLYEIIQLKRKRSLASAF